ncbi:MAG: CPBP family intramembrane metalloprotease [Proteobacteria bacterium]|nr:CPBP family intramembrane metalloprotease [Pseudomonadota bacterium]
MASEYKPLIEKDYRPIPGWALLLFVAAVAVLSFLGLQFLAGQGVLTILVTFYAIGLCAVLLAVAPLGRAAAPALGLRPSGWRPVVFGMIGTIVLSVGVSQLGIEPKAMKEVTDMMHQTGMLAPGLIALAFLAPVVEELVFRGLLYGWVAGRWGTVAAWIVSSITFALAHYEPAHILLVLPLGILFGYLRRRTDSLLPSLAAHIFNNGFAVLAAAYLGS